MRRLVLILLAGCLMTIQAGCRSEPDPPDNLLPEEVYTDLLLETFMISYLIEMQGMQAESDSVYTSLYNSYGVTRAAFDSSHNWYNRNPANQIERVEAIRKRLEEEIRLFDQFVNDNSP